jgi:hypothetical protein
MRQGVPVDSQRPTTWHFYVDDDIARAVVGWDPDREPERFASGLGHNLLELYARLRARGLPVTIGRSIPDDASLVVYFQHAWARYAELPLALRAAPFHTAVIRSDAPLWWSNLLPAELVAVPNSAPVWHEQLGSRAVHLPALPQRGLIARGTGREGVRKVVFKGYGNNVPGYLLEPAFREELDGRRVSLILDTPERADGADQRWHDFGEVDAMLCVRGAAADDSLLNKPPTRLINAWCAGVIPLVEPEPAYLELVRDGVDGFVVAGPGDILSTLDHLSVDDELTASVFAAVRDRGQEFQTDVLLDRWIAALERASGPRYGAAQTIARRLVVLGRFARWVTGAVRRRVVERLSLRRA